MTCHLQAAVIGGGVTGCSILYHLVKAGWKEVALFERKELTAGATWHSSGHIGHFAGNPQLTRFALETRAMLDTIEAATGQLLGLRETGSLRMATSTESYRDFAQFAETAAGVACDAQMISPEEVGIMWPLAKLDGIKGALLIKADCHLNAADLTQGLARAARNKGAIVHRQVEVTSLAPRPGGGWTLSTDEGDWTAEHVITATGIFARRTLRNFGIDLPVAALSHQYLVTEPVQRIAERRAAQDAPLPILRQPDIGLNIREEGDGFCISLYEQNAAAVFPVGPPASFGMELFPEDFESIEAGFEGAMARVPCLAEAAIRSTVHGPMPWSPDFAPIVGPVPAARGLWVAEAMSYGVSWSAGVARTLTDWITNGDPGEDTSALDCRRFGPYATADWADERAIATYKGVYGTGASPAPPETSVIHDILEAEGAVFEEIRGRAVARTFPGGPLAANDCALYVPPRPVTLRVYGTDADKHLTDTLSGHLPAAPRSETTARLLSPGNTVLAGIRIRRHSAPSGFELAVEGACPQAVAEELRCKAGYEPELTIADPEAPLDALILIGDPDAANFSDSIHLPADTTPGTIIDRALPDGTVGRAIRLPDLDRRPRWELIHPETAHRGVFEACRIALPEARLLGTQDYAALQITAGEPVFGREIDANLTCEGCQVAGFNKGEVATAQLARISVDASPDTVISVGTVLRDPGGAPVGRVVSLAARQQTLVGFAMLSPHALDEGIEPIVISDGSARSVTVTETQPMD